MADPWAVVDTTPSPQQPAAEPWSVASDTPPAAPAQPQRSTISDITQGAGRGLVQGATALAGLPVDVADMIDHASRWLVAKAFQKAGLDWNNHADDFINQKNELANYLGSQALERGVIAGAKAAGVPLENAQTVPGQYAQTIASFLPAAATMGTSAPALLKNAVIPGALSETAGQATKGSALEPYARIAGAIAPAIPSAAMSTLETIASPMSGSMRTAAPQKLAEAQDLLDQSRAAGAPLTSGEAVQAVTGSGTSLGNAQRVVEQSPQGAPIMKPFFAQRPAQVETLGRRTINEISPTTIDPYELAPRVQGAAEGVVQGARNETNALSRPAYEATANNPNALVSPQAFDAIRRQPAMEQALKAVRSDPVKYGDLRGLQDNSMPVLDAAKKYLDDVTETAKRAGENFAATNASNASSDLLSIMDTEFPRYASARNIQSMRQRYVEEPLSRSPTGQLAEAPTFQKQREILFSDKPLDRSEAAIGRAVKDVVKADPEAANLMVGQYLGERLNAALKTNQGGPNQWAGPKFSTAITGDPQKAKNLEAAIRSLPDGNAKWKATRQALNILDGMGQRLPVGSPTETNKQYNELLKNGKALGELATTITSPGKWANLAHQVYQKFSYGQNTEQLARILTEGNVSDLVKLSDAGAKSMKAQMALVGLLARAGAIESPATGQSSP